MRPILSQIDIDNVLGWMDDVEHVEDGQDDQGLEHEEVPLVRGKIAVKPDRELDEPVDRANEDQGAADIDGPQ